jgi:hypothetical protein
MPAGDSATGSVESFARGLSTRGLSSRGLPGGANGSGVMRERRTKRRHVTETLEVSSPTLRGQVLNLSMDGLAIETVTPLKPGKRVTLRIDGEGSLMTGSVCWSRLKRVRSTANGGSEAVYHAGIRLDQEPDDPPTP